MFSHISPAIIIALVTFLWYRKGRLWNFYDSLSTESIKQMESDSIDRIAWEKIAAAYIEKLSGDLINSTFRFEILYLKNKINKSKYDFWIGDSSTKNGVTKRITDKKKYGQFLVKQLLYSEFRYCGLFLFINSLKLKFCTLSEDDPGFTEGD